MSNINDFRSRLLKEDVYNINVNKYVDKIKNAGNIIIWGSALSGQQVFEFCKKFGISNNVKYFADNNKEKWVVGFTTRGSDK